MLRTQVTGGVPHVHQDVVGSTIPQVKGVGQAHLAVVHGRAELPLGVGNGRVERRVGRLGTENVKHPIMHRGTVHKCQWCSLEKLPISLRG